MEATLGAGRRSTTVMEGIRAELPARSPVGKFEASGRSRRGRVVPIRWLDCVMTGDEVVVGYFAAR